MKKTPRATDELDSDYSLDYSTAKPNRFATQSPNTVVMITLDPDITAVFHTSKAVNDVLRAIVRAMPVASHSAAVQRKIEAE